ncbi:MAG: KEOPS complex subunit Pcc1 [Methanobacterium sp.]|nr:KEOPS complex subunit Pcc1 [Methanobacterium sp.]
MKIKAIIKFKYKNEDITEIIYQSLKPDNIGYIDSTVKDNNFICGLNGDSIGTILATADDLVFCETIIEKVSELIK